jgi:hypothetical protein
VTCASCGDDFCSRCRRCTDSSLPFVYCEKCMDELNEADATMNLDLLRILVAKDGKDLVA